MLPDIDQLSQSIIQWRILRDCGSVLLLLSVFFEAIVDRYWPESTHPPLLRGRRATTLLEERVGWIRKRVAFGLAILVFVGIGIEWYAGGKVDTKTDDLRTNLETKLVRVMPRPALLYGDNRNRLVAALKNTRFQGQKVETRYCEMYFSRQYIDNDTMSVAMLLPYIMKLAGWDAEFAKRQKDCNGEGIWIQVAPNASAHTRDAAAALTKALKEVPLVADQTADLNPPEEPPSDVSAVVVTVEAPPPF